MDVYFISAVTWTPDRWNHNQPSSLLMYNPQQAVTELYNSSRNGPPCRVWISNVAGANVIASSFTSHDTTACHPVEPLLCVCGLHFMVYLSVNPLYHAGGVTWWGKKIERYSGKLEFFTACVNRNPSMPSFAATALVVFSLCGKVL